jgi:hypothetical protein
LQEGVSRALTVLELWKKNPAPDTGGGNGLKKTESKNFLDFFFPALKKNRVQEILRLCFFQTISPPCLGLCFFQSTKAVSALDTPSCNFSEPGFWILTKGG